MVVVSCWSRVTLVLQPTVLQQRGRMSECIHGLEMDRCDICAPRDQDRAARTSQSPKPARARPTRKSAPIASSAPVAVDPGARRIFHLTHVLNLPGILAHGRVLADAAGAKPVVDISASDNRELRREVTIGSATVSSFVPFFLVPDARLWEGIRAGEADYRLDDAIRSTPASDFVLLVSTAGAVGQDSVIADGDAADPTTRFVPLSELHGRMPRRLYDEEDALRVAEFLVSDHVEFSDVNLVGVANDKVRAAVREQLGEYGFTQKVSVYPPWFQRP